MSSHFKHPAIYELYPNTAYIRFDENGLQAFDSDDNLVEFDDTVVTAKAEQLEASYNLELLRAERNKRLADTDYWDASDTPQMSQDQVTYRQALRDITNSYTSLDDVVWPTKPE